MKASNDNSHFGGYEMNNKFKPVLILLLVLILAFSLAGCNPEDKGPGGKTPTDEIPKQEISKPVLMETLHEALAAQKTANAGAEVLNITSQYTIIVHGINYQFDYQANYIKNRDRDSEIYLRIFDAQFYQNVVLVYYNGDDLFLQLDGKYTKYEDFGSSSFFPAFFATITKFDFNEFLASDEFKDTLDTLITLCDAKKIVNGKIAGNREYVEIKDIPLDTRRETINDAVKATLGIFEDKFDLLSMRFLDVKLSDLAKLEVSTINGRLLTIALKDNQVNDISFKLDGKLSNNIDEYSINFRLATAPERKAIKLADIDDPAKSSYDLGNFNSFHYTGTFEIPLLDILYDTDIKMDLNTADNDTNKLFIRFSESDVDQGSIFYKDGVFYLDVSGIYSRLQGSMDLDYMNLPKIKKEGINLADEIDKAMGYLLRVAEDMAAGGTVLDPNIELPDRNAFSMLVSKMTTTDNTITVNIDKELLTLFTGDEDINIIEVVGEFFGLTEELLNFIFGEVSLEDSTIAISYNLDTKEITISLVAEQVILLRFRIFRQEVVREEFVIDYPANFDESHYLDFVKPEEIQYDIQGTIRAIGQGASSGVDLSTLFGVFIGDITGVNTPYTLRSDQVLSIEALGSDAEGNQFYCIIKDITNPENVKSLISIYAPYGDMLYIDFHLYNISYRIPKAAVIQGFSELAEGGDAFAEGSISHLFNALMKHAVTTVKEDGIEIALNPLGGKDPLKELIGIGNLSVQLKAKLSFEADTITVDEAAYPEPVLLIEEGLVMEFESMYEVVWLDQIDVRFGAQTRTFDLSFIGESAQFRHGTYLYKPEAKLFGGIVSYTMLIRDTSYGTKEIIELALEGGKLTIDPADAQPLPDTIPVLYEDGTMGEIAYEIEGFGAYHIQLTGMPLRYYNIIIGKGSIGERIFRTQIEVLNRVIYPLEITDQYRYNVPIVKQITIDPYYYALMNLQGEGTYNPIYQTPLELVFGSNMFEGKDDPVVIPDFEWDINPDDHLWGFTLDAIDYNGGVGYIKGRYKTLEIGLKVIIKAKQADYIQLEGEERGSYTVDSLIASSYTIPTYSAPGKEIRLYFKDGTFRIIGEPEDYQQIFNPGYNPTGEVNFNGYWPFPLSWNHPVVNNLNGTTAQSYPFQGTTENITKTEFGVINNPDVFFSVGNQKNIGIIVDVPSRQVSSATHQIQAIVNYEIEDGEIVRVDSEGVWPSLAAFPDKVAGGQVVRSYSLGEAYDFDPYDSAPIPSFIEIEAEYAGVISRRSYPIVWEASSLISADGRILHPNSSEVYFKVVGYIGDGLDRTGRPIREEIILLVKNLEAMYSSIRIEGLPEGVLTMNVDPYAPLNLPSSFTLTFPDKQATFQASWKMQVGGQWVSIDNDTKFVATGPEYNPSIEIVTFVEKGDGILEQQVSLTLNILRRTVLAGRIGGIVNGEVENIVIDTYLPYSKTLYDKIEAGIDTVNVFMSDGALNYEYSNLPVEWQNIDALKQMLTSPASGSIQLTGHIFTGEANEQEVTCNFIILPRVLDGVEFSRIIDNPELISVDYDLANKVIQITLNKVFALTDPETGRNVLPYAYLNNVLSEVSVRFANGEFGTFRPIFDLGTEASFNAQIFNDEVDITNCAFYITKLSTGSNLDGFTLNIQTKQDQPLQPTFYEFIMLFDKDGNFRYPTGYPITGNLEVEYKYSGTIRYTDMVWLAAVDIGDIPQGNQVHNILLSNVKMTTGQSYHLASTLPNGMQLQKIIVFQKADMKDTGYNAQAQDPLYNITGGNIVINNIYNYKNFDITKLPDKILPLPSDSFFMEEQIAFNVEWEILEDNLDQIGAEGYPKTKIAQATIYGSGGDTQVISLYLTVNALINAEYNISQISVSHPNPGENYIYIDPYLHNFGGNFVLPDNIVMVFNNGAQSISMNKTAHNFYYEWNGAPILSIPYNHLGHTLEAENANEIQVTLVLGDGNRVPIDFYFQDRTLSEIFIPNKITTPLPVDGEYTEGGVRYVNLSRTYYIDPYDASTHTVPARIYIAFEQGENIYINVEWTAESGFAINYSGGTYTFYSSLQGYGEGLDPQPFQITVIVLNRSLQSAYSATHYFEDPIGGMVSDINSELEFSDFVDLPNDYLAFGIPVIPHISWNINDNEIGVQGMAPTPKTGYLTNNGYQGEEAHVTISVAKWSFAGVYMDEAGMTPLANNRFRFNAFSGDTISEYFYLKFEKDDSGTYTYVRFYSEKREVDDIGKRHLIFWDPSVALSFEVQIGKISIGNAFKTQRVVSQGYGYVYRQITVTALDLGYNAGGSETPVYVVDPLNPVFPSVADAYCVEGALGKIPVEWSSNVTNVIFNGGQRAATVTLYPFGGTPQVLNVTVYYLDRTPLAYSTSLPNYSTIPDPANPGYYQLPGLTGSINPINLAIYDDVRGEYILPASLRVRFSDYAGNPNDFLREAAQRYKYVLDLVDIIWNMSGDRITLAGTPAGSPLVFPMISYKVSREVEDGDPVVSGRINSVSSLLSIKFNVMQKDIVATTISDAANVHQAAREYYIDPYNVSFPTSIGVWYRDEIISRDYHNLVWSYDTSLLTNPLFINGSYGEENMYINATIQLFAQSFNIDFKVIPRHINIINEQGQLIPLNGGTIYVLKGKPLLPQLPTSIYYQFVNPFDSNDTSWQLIPLVFNPLDLAAINVNKVSSYTGIGARMGIEFDLDIVYFNIEVVDPVLRDYDEENFMQGSSVYDYISVARTEGGEYLPGKEVDLIPQHLAISSNNTINIVDVSYDFSQNYAILSCTYPITGASPALGGTILTTRSFGLTFRVPLRSYVYNYLDSPPSLTQTAISHLIGTPLIQSQLPQAELNGVYYPLMWDMSSVNINRAGTYVIFGYYTDAFYKESSLALTVTIDKINVTQDNVSISEEWLEREYSGEVVPPDIEIDRFLREDGSYQYIEYLIQYSINGSTWFLEQPTATTPSGSHYYIKLSFNDYNVHGELIYTFVINKQVIRAESIVFVNEITGNNVLVYYFNGTTFSPLVTGLPEDCLYNVQYTKDGVPSPLYDAGIYEMSVTIPSQLNYRSAQSAFYTQVIIERAIVNYEIISEIPYDSTYQHCKISGLPEILPADMSVTYLYSYGTTINSPNPVRNVGTYNVRVTINGGRNYPSDDTIVGQFSITRRDLIITAGVIEVEYLQEFNNEFIRSKVTYQGLQRNDRVQDFGTLLISTPATSKSIIGDYPITFSGLSHTNYRIIYEQATLRIAPSATGNTAVINGRNELLAAIEALDDSVTPPQITWYLTAGDYGDIVLNKNAAIIMVGAYSLVQGEYVIGTTFSSLTVNKGTLTIDIARFSAISNSNSLIIGQDMSGIKISRAEFINSTAAVYTNAIVTDIKFGGSVQLLDTQIKGYTLGVFMPGGSIRVERCSFEENAQAIRIMNGEIECYNSAFLRNADYALYIAYQYADTILFGNTFIGNKYAVASIEADLLDPSKGYLIENTFRSNAKDLLKLS
jgi:hypothetical protein